MSPFGIVIYRCDVAAMEQIVGQSCVLCRKTIDSIAEGQFCRFCGQAVHNSCMVRTIDVPDNQCEWCGARLDDGGAVRQRLEVLQRIEAERNRQDALRATFGQAPSELGCTRLLFWIVAGLVVLTVLGVMIWFFQVCDGGSWPQRREK
jgi:hypothetical protein